MDGGSFVRVAGLSGDTRVSDPHAPISLSLSLPPAIFVLSQAFFCKLVPTRQLLSPIPSLSGPNINFPNYD